MGSIPVGATNRRSDYYNRFSCFYLEVIDCSSERYNLESWSFELGDE